MRERSVAFFCMPETGHFQRLRSLISGLSRMGVTAHVFTHQKFAPDVERAGGLFFDLFSKYPLEEADDSSVPVPCRFVTFAGRYAESICRDVKKTQASLVIHDTFSVIGRVVARHLGIPRVNVCAGHNVVPQRYLAILQDDPRVNISPRCLHAVEILRKSYGIEDASPFSYVSSLSSDLNIYCEPPEFLGVAERQPFEPIAFYGSLPSLEGDGLNDPEASSFFGPATDRRLKVYVSFGTVVWRYFRADALKALATLTAAFAELENLQAVISLGGTKIDDQTIAELTKPNVSLESYVDQWGILKEADVFFTHHGMNSTHEAIFHRAPMVSYPFFWDQPGLAAKCQGFRLATPLAASPREAFGKDDVHAALARLTTEKAVMHEALSRACGWEKAVIDSRPSVLQRVLDIMGCREGGPL